MEQFLIAQRLINLYCFNRIGYAVMDQGGEYHTSNGVLDDSVVFDHLDGKLALSVSARERNTSFLCFDVDERDPDHIRRLVDKLEAEGIPRDEIYISDSGNKGYHVDIFFDVPVWKSIAENFFKYIRRDPEIARIRMECKPIRRSKIKIPLGINFKTGRRCWYVDRETLEPIEDFEYIFNIQRIPASMFQAIVLRCNKIVKAEDIAKAKSSPQIKREKTRRKEFVNFNEPKITEQGQRHELMLKKAVWLRTIGGDEEEIYDELIRWIERQDMSLIGSSRSDIEHDARYIARDVVRKYDVKTPTKQYIRSCKSVLTPDDIYVIRSIKKKNARKIALLICAYCRVYGKCRVSYEQMAKIIGVTTKTANTAVNWLVENKVVRKTRVGGVTYLNKKPVLQPNEYEMCKTANGCAGKSVNILIDSVKDNFESFYNEVVGG